MEFEPIERGGEAEDAEERAGGLFIAGGYGAPLLQSRPETLDAVAVVVDRLRAGDRSLVAAGRDGRTHAEAPGVLAEGMAAVAAVGHHPHRHAGQAREQRHGVGQFVRLARREGEGDRPSRAVGGDHAGSEACL